MLNAMKITIIYVVAVLTNIRLRIWALYSFHFWDLFSDRIVWYTLHYSYLVVQVWYGWNLTLPSHFESSTSLPSITSNIFPRYLSLPRLCSWIVVAVVAWPTTATTTFVRPINSFILFTTVMASAYYEHYRGSSYVSSMNEWTFVLRSVELWLLCHLLHS